MTTTAHAESDGWGNCTPQGRIAQSREEAVQREVARRNPVRSVA